MKAVPESWIAVAHELADIAGPILRRHFRTPVAAETKPDRTPVTVADREAEAAMRRHLARRLPDHAVAGEEYGGEIACSGPVWCIDPIDGTKAFLAGRPTFGLAVALVVDGEPVLGLVDQPIVGDRWIAARGHGLRWNGRPVRARPCAALADAIASATSPEMFLDTPLEPFYRTLCRRVRFFVYGGDCVGYALMASGLSDLVVEADLKPFDFLPLVPVVEEAGGRFTDLSGHRPDPAGSGVAVVAAGDARIHAAVLELAAQLLRPAAPPSP